MGFTTNNAERAVLGTKLLGFAFVLFCVTCAANADVRLPLLLADSAVLQRNVPIHFWGDAAPGEQVTVTLASQTGSTVADDLGRWHIYSPPMRAGGPFEVVIQGRNRIVLHDIMIGDVWVASGQSNMEFAVRQLKEGAEEIANANVPNIRLFVVKRAYSEYPVEEVVSTGWARCSPDSVRDFSAVAYYFARRIAERERVAVGVIESTWGGTVVEAWTSLDALSSDAALMPTFAGRAYMMDRLAQDIREQQKQAEETAAAKEKGLPAPEVKWHPEPNMWEPAALFNGMVAPLTPFAVRGFIWYQGESNSRLHLAPALYGRQFRTMIEDWRARWGEGDLPFLFVQIANFTSTAEEDWALIREGQRDTLRLRNTGMAVTIDIGNPDDVHPLDKKDVADRLALIARAQVYGEQIEYSGPLFRELTREPNALRIYFDHGGSGLAVKGPALTGFEVAAADGRFQPALARIDGTTIVVSSPAVPTPLSVRYGWANNPACNLFNSEGLPASPFTASLPPMH
jgi:sialate O-acetylesterase